MNKDEYVDIVVGAYNNWLSIKNLDDCPFFNWQRKLYMNEIKDFEIIEIKSPEDDFNNFVIVRYDWPCNIQEITEVVSKFRNQTGL